MIIDIEAFKAKKPWLDILFWAAMAATVAMLIPLLQDSWGSAKFPTGSQMAAACAPLTAYLVMHGLVRRSAVTAYGNAVATEVMATTAADAQTTAAAIHAGTVSPAPGVARAPEPSNPPSESNTFINPTLAVDLGTEVDR